MTCQILSMMEHLLALSIKVKRIKARCIMDTGPLLQMKVSLTVIRVAVKAATILLNSSVRSIAR